MLFRLVVCNAFATSAKKKMKGIPVLSGISQNLQTYKLVIIHGGLCVH